MTVVRWLFQHPPGNEVFAEARFFDSLQQAINSLDAIWHQYIGTNTIVLFTVAGASIYYRMYEGNWIHIEEAEAANLVIMWNEREAP